MSASVLTPAFMPVSSLSATARQRVLHAMENHALPDTFYALVEAFYAPIGHDLANSVGDQVLFVGVQGSQGSGKSTCADFLKVLLENEYGLQTLVMSIDDFYLTKAERQSLADRVHPLFATRGVPGTHDTDLIQSVFRKTQAGEHFLVPTFDKSIDDRAPETEWQQVSSKLNVVILEGWCVGIPAQTIEQLDAPCNDLERNEDSQKHWRLTVNKALSETYAELFARLDRLVAIQAPSFDCVFEWRLLQEQKMIARLQQAGKDTSQAQTPAQLQRFIAHYQRLTEHALTVMPELSDYILYLNPDHSFKSLETKSSLAATC